MYVCMYVSVMLRNAITFVGCGSLRTCHIYFLLQGFSDALDCDKEFVLKICPGSTELINICGESTST